MNENLDVRDYVELDNAMALSQHTVYKRYLSELEQYPLVAPTPILLDEETSSSVRVVMLDELSCKKGEDMFQKLTTVYNASMSLGCNLIVMVDVERLNSPAKIYVGVRNHARDDDARKKLSTSYRTLQNGINSNFPGTRFHEVSSSDALPRLIDDIFSEQTKHISSVSCVASARDKAKTENKSFVQGIEHFIDAMKGNTYTAVFLAEPISSFEQAEIRQGYENLYSMLYSFKKSVWSYNENDSRAVMESLSTGISKAITDGTSHTQAHTVNIGMNLGINSSSMNSQTNSHTVSNGTSSPTTASRVGSAMVAAGNFAKLIGPIVTCINPAAGGALLAANGLLTTAGSAMQGGSTSSSASDTIANTIGKCLGISGGLSAGYSKTTSDTTSHSETNTTSETKTSGTTTTHGSGKTLQIENVNKTIDEMLKRIDEQLKRTQEGEDYGAYSCAAYFLSGKQESSLLAANTFRALMLGEGSSVESSAINTWNGNKEPEKVDGIKEYLKRFVHPIFAMAVSNEVQSIDDMITYTPGTIVSGLELPLHLGLPTKSVYGLPVIEHAEFGRNVKSRDYSEDNANNLSLGDIYHMGEIEHNSKVELDLSSLASHTFITGSTGSGKSTTIYSMIDKLLEKDIRFMVVEPAKGEYKNRFGSYDYVSVYGTNSKKMPLLRINPFSFPEDIHVLEHIDRLIDIFNVCWPMYAAMPAVLKDSIERAYVVSGWNLETSQCRYKDNQNTPLFPTFEDVLNQINIVMNESAYSSDSKGDYKGALCTRLKSLTNGLYRQIFTSDELSGYELFESNVIINLSRTGSSETKSLIMGLLVLKLQEYRMANATTQNEKLKHITVLEEAHNILKRTSTEQASESANLIGKSVEMIANSIAEMRTYGEGFIIADQAPGLMDMSVIRNTNTKIILRLPDLEDRQLVGYAANLNDDQIQEVARLDNFVAAVYQNSWLEPVLCKIDTNFKDFPQYSYKGECGKKLDLNRIIEYLLIPISERNELDSRYIDELIADIYKLPISTESKIAFIHYTSASTKKDIQELRRLVLYQLFNFDTVFGLAKNRENDIDAWYNCVCENLEPSIEYMDTEKRNKVIASLVMEKTIIDGTNETVELFDKIMNHISRR